MVSMYHQFWVAVANYYQKNLSDVQIEQYAANTRPLNEQQLNDAFEKWRESSHFMPTPSDINGFFQVKEVTAWQFCSELLSIIKDHPIPGPGQKSGIEKVLSKDQFDVYTSNEYRDAIRYQPPKTAMYALMNAIEVVKNKRQKKPRGISINDIKQLDFPE